MGLCILENKTKENVYTNRFTNKHPKRFWCDVKDNDVGQNFMPNTVEDKFSGGSMMLGLFQRYLEPYYDA